MKCPTCGCAKEKHINYYYDDYGIIEYKAICEDCEEPLYQYAYGSYDYFDDTNTEEDTDDKWSKKYNRSKRIYETRVTS